MKMNELSLETPRKSRKRIGRGHGSGWGKTAGKGHNGQKQRAGFSQHAAFEGGQMPLVRRIPKRGFSNSLFRKHFDLVNLSTLEVKFEDGATVTPEALVEAGIIKNVNGLVKVLGKGELTKKLTVSAHKVSASAKSAIEAKGGNVEIIEIKTFADVAGNAKK